MSEPSRTPRPRLPAFAPVPVKRRADGWTPLRQAEFIGVLAETGSVRAAARVGMARKTAYRLRGRPGAEEFARAWDAALVIAGNAAPGAYRVTPAPPKVTEEERLQRLLAIRWQPVLRRGKFVGRVCKSRNTALLKHLRGSRRGFRKWRAALARARSREDNSFSNVSPSGPGPGGPSALRPVVK